MGKFTEGSYCTLWRQHVMNDTSPYLVLTPVFNDWEALQPLLMRLDQTLRREHLRADVLAVDDGSNEQAADSLELGFFQAIGRVSILHLRCNLGHQRAIAVGLAYVEAHTQYEAVVVMDADGEDSPEHVPLMILAHRMSVRPRVVFGLRAKRSEGWLFRIFYWLYRRVFQLLTGKNIRIGNFSLIPFCLLHRVVALSDVWVHYASAMIKSRLPFVTLPCARGNRIAGHSKMSFVTLTTHGLSAISVYADTVGTRLLIATSAIALLAAFLAVLVVVIRLSTDWAIPGWATSAFGMCIIAAVQAVTLAFVLALMILNRRSQLSFLPVRDFRYFVSTVEVLYPLQDPLALETPLGPTSVPA
jgi:polyisoprenyl-phosphate glycosyltransferase